MAPKNARKGRTTEQVLSQQNEDADRDRTQSPRSGTQALASQTNGTGSNDLGENTAVITQELAFEAVRHHAGTMQSACLMFIYAGAVAYIVTVKANAKGKKGYGEVTTLLTALIAERNVKKSMAYNYLKTAQDLAGYLDRTYKNGSIMGVIMTSPTTDEAIAQLAAHMARGYAVTSFNTLAQAIVKADGSRVEAAWTAEAAARYAADKAKRDSPQGKAAQTRASNKALVNKAIEKGVLSTIVAQISTDESQTAIDTLTAALESIGSVTVLEACKAKIEERITVLKSEQGPQGSKPFKGSEQHVH